MKSKYIIVKFRKICLNTKKYCLSFNVNFAQSCLSSYRLIIIVNEK